MGRQPFRQMKANATAKSADDAVSVTLPGHGVNITRTPDSSDTATFAAMIPITPKPYTNSFSSSDMFYYAQKVYFLPMYSACGGVIEHLIPYSGGETGTADTDDWKFGLYDAGNGGLPKTLISNTMQWTPDSTYNPTYLDVTDTSAGELTLSADTWYWIAILGASSSNGGNIAMGTHGQDRGPSTQIVSRSGTAASQYYWNAGSQTSFPTPLTINSASNELVATGDNNHPRWFFQYKIESDESFKGA